MYQIQPYDLSKSFRFIPFGEKYQLTIWQENSVKFKSRKDAFRFITAISNFFNEILQLCELINSNNNLYRFQIAPKSKSNHDKFSIYCKNDEEINAIIRDLKYFQNEPSELYQIVKKYATLIYLIKNNTEILYKKIGKELAGNYVLICNIDASAKKVLTNPHYYFTEKKFSIFTN